MTANMDDLKKKFQGLQAPVRYAILAVVAVVGLIVVFKILPAILGGLGLILILVLFIGPYWIPTIIAFSRKHPSKGGVLALNLFLGWTFIGWVVALVWALSDNSRAGTSAHASVIVNTHITHAPYGPAAPVYQVGDVVNGHRFNGVVWLPLSPAAPTAVLRSAPPHLPPAPITQAAPSQLPPGAS